MLDKIKATKNETQFNPKIEGQKMKINVFAYWEGATGEDENAIGEIVGMTGNFAFYYAGKGNGYEFIRENGTIGWLSGQCFTKP